MKRRENNAMCCVANSKSRLHAATLLVTSKNMSRKVLRNQFPATLFSEVAEHFCSKTYPWLRAALIFFGRGNNFWTCSVLSPFQAKSRTCSPRINYQCLFVWPRCKTLLHKLNWLGDIYASNEATSIYVVARGEDSLIRVVHQNIRPAQTWKALLQISETLLTCVYF